MKISVRLPDPDYPISIDELASIAVAAEDSGFDACAVTDHPFPIIDASATGHHTLDPFALLAFLAGVTNRIQLHTSLIVLPYRNPFLTANAGMTVDVLSKGRLILGVGTGYLHEEFRALGVSVEQRNELFDEYLDAILLAWSGEPLSASGSGWHAAGNTLWPLPASMPHPPIWIGGNTMRAIRRAVHRGDGWSPVVNPPDRARRIRTALIDNVESLTLRMNLFKDELNRAERAVGPDVCVVSAERLLNSTTPRLRANRNEIVEGIKALEDLGVTWITLRPSGDSAAEIIEWMSEFSSAVLDGRF